MLTQNSVQKLSRKSAHNPEVNSLGARMTPDIHFVQGLEISSSTPGLEVPSSCVLCSHPHSLRPGISLSPPAPDRRSPLPRLARLASPLHRASLRLMPKGLLRISFPLKTILKHRVGREWPQRSRRLQNKSKDERKYAEPRIPPQPAEATR